MVYPEASSSALLIKRPLTTSGWYYIKPQGFTRQWFSRSGIL